MPDSKSTLLGILMLIRCFLSAQESEYRNYTIHDGLPSNEIYHVMEDSKGYLWFSTDRGVSRFNGYAFENFTTVDGLADNTVFLCYEDSKGRIWMLSYASLLCYFENNTIHPFPFNESIRQLKLKRDIKTSMSINQGNIQVGTSSQGYYKIDSTGTAEIIQSGKLLTISKTANDYLLYGEIFKPNTLPKNEYLFLGNAHSLEAKLKKPICPRLAIGKNNLYVSDGTNVFFLKHKALERKLTSNNFTINSIYEDAKGSFWVGFVEGGARQYSFADSTMVLEEILAGQSVSHITEDREGGKWFTTLGEGVFYKPPGTAIMPLHKNKLPDKEIKDILLPERGNAFVSYADGSVWELTKGGRVKQVDLFENPLHKGAYNPLVFIEKDNKLITKPKADKILKKESSKIVEHINTTRNVCYPDRIVNFNIKLLEPDASGGFWIGTNNGMYCFKHNALERIINPSYLVRGNDTTSLTRTVVDASHSSVGGTLYLSTLEGLCTVRNNELVSLADRHPLLNARIDDIDQLGDGTILLASRGYGIIVWNGDTAISIGIKEGLSNNLVNSICVDGEDIIWAGTNDGLNRIRLRQGKAIEIAHFTTTHGLLSKHITKVQASRNAVWIGTLKGLFKLKKNSICNNSTPPRMIVRSVKINDRDTCCINDFVLKHNQNQIRFDYVGIAYKAEGNLTYQYQLEGLDDHWKFTQNTGVSYASLSPGAYAFKIKAANEDKVWSHPATIHFTILPPFWLRWWFVGIEVLGGLSIVLIIIKKRENRIKEKADFQKRSIQAELKALRAQMNPHFTFNILGSIQQFILQNEPIVANDYLSQFARLTRSVLENSRHSKISLYTELETLKLYLSLEKLRLCEKLDFQIEVDPVIDLHQCKVPPLLIQPFVENAIVHGIAHKQGKGTILVEFIDKSDSLYCIITDNGIGRKESMLIQAESQEKRQSYGIPITRERLELIKKTEHTECHVTVVDLEDKRSLPMGTQVTICIPN